MTRPFLPSSPSRPAGVRGVAPLVARIAAFVLLCLALVAAGPARAVTVERVVSPKGIEAWLVRDPTIPIISLELAFRGGAASDPAEKTGLARMVAALLDEGAGDLDSRAFQERLNDLAISLHFDASADYFMGGLKTLTEHRDEAFELLRAAARSNGLKLRGLAEQVVSSPDTPAPIVRILERRSDGTESERRA